MKKILIPITAFLTCISSISFSQSKIKESEIRLMEKEYQSCLNKGVDMLGCSARFYKDMDSCLNIAYKQLEAMLANHSKSSLKKEQIAWLKVRDLEFQKIDKAHKGDVQDERMFRFDEKANFVKERVFILLRRAKK